MNPIIKAVSAGLLVATATYAVAHEGKHDETKRTVIIKEVHGDHADAGAHAGPVKCTAPEVDVTDEKKEEGGHVKRSRVVICSDGKHGVDVVQHLERARERIAKQEELSSETRSKALAALDAAIARHKGAAK